jgi:hypothetical protein
MSRCTAGTNAAWSITTRASVVDALYRAKTQTRAARPALGFW